MFRRSCTLNLRPDFRHIPHAPRPCTLNLHPHIGAALHALRVAYPQVGPTLRSHPVCSEGRVPSTRSLASEPPRMLRGRRTVSSHPLSGAIPHAPRVMYTHFGATSQAPKSCTLTLDPRLRDIPHILRIAYPQTTPLPLIHSTCPEGRVPLNCALTSEPSRIFRGLRTLKVGPFCGRTPHDPKDFYCQLAALLRSHPACAQGSVSSSCALTSELSRMLRGSRTL